MTNSFENKKELRFIITLGTGKFGSSSNNQIRLEGYRATVEIDKMGYRQMGTLRAQIYGMSLSDMRSITTLQWKPGWVIGKNKIEVYAIDGAQETLVYAGNIINAWANLQNPPDVFLNINAGTAWFAQLTPVNPRSYNGQIDVASIMGQIAKSMGLYFENNGVQVQLSDTYLANTDVVQAQTLADAADITLYIDDDTLAITPRNVPRGGLIPEISAQTGLMGYPIFDLTGTTFQTLFTPSLTFGGAFKLITELPDASGQFFVTSLSHRLEAEKPGGAWFSSAHANVTRLVVLK